MVSEVRLISVFFLLLCSVWVCFFFQRGHTNVRCALLLPPAQLEQQAVEAAAEERHHAELQHAYKELLHMEDWSGASRDRFLGVRSNTAFEQRLKQAR